ncbi:MAG: zinc ribbon domain-containing protein [Acidobacteriota bacterium]|jgi:putative FmdB family regulatory protein
MPLYEYECDACHKRFEKLQRLSDPLLTVCPQCGGAVHKRISAPAIQFKGTGWYVTDYGKGSSSASKAGRSESGGSKDKGSKSS